jgi:glycosyl transferase family 25
MQSYILHLARSSERDGLVRDLCAILPNAKVLPAVEGSALTQDERDAAYQPSAIKPHYPFPSKAGELGCFLSHRKFWKTLVESDEQMMWVAEDDVAISAVDFATLEALVTPHADVNCLIRVPIRNREKAKEIIAQSGDMQLVRPEVIGLTTAMYLIGRDAAQRMLDLTQPFDRPVDTFLQMRWLTGVDSLTVLNSGARSAAFDVGGSTIQTKKSVIQEIKRMTARATYRARVRKLSAKGIS